MHFTAAISRFGELLRPQHSLHTTWCEYTQIVTADSNWDQDLKPDWDYHNSLSPCNNWLQTHRYYPTNMIKDN
jgi:hypothetical protein